tara:strand:+ start:2269 stop:3375 length:1107 start_codon:yes stop_codon:yes gene_type:complete
MNKVAIIGTGQTKFSKDENDVEKLLYDSSINCINSIPELNKNKIDGVLVSTNSDSKYMGAILSETLEIQPKISHTIENLCSSGTSAISSAFSYIASGLADTILVSGADSSNNSGQVLKWDKTRGSYDLPIFWATMLTKIHKREFHTTEEELAIVSAKNHKHAIENPNAYSNKAKTISEIMNSKQITDDLRLLDCSRSCSGSASIILTSENTAKKITNEPIWIKGIGQKTTAASFTKNTFNSNSSTKLAGKMAYDMANILPDKIDVAEIHDAFTVCELMAVADLGMSTNDESGNYIRNLFNTENRRINPRGGLIGSGHPLGATGVAQTIEITQQLQGKAGKRQIPNVRNGLIHNMSAAGTSSTVLVLSN